MPLQTIALDAGVNVEATKTQNSMVIQSSQLIRFKAAGKMVLVEKLGGWLKFHPQSVGSAIRALHAWEGVNADSHLGIGAESSLSVLRSGVYGNITPRTLTDNVTPNFSTVSGSKVVTIIDTNVQPTVYDTIYLVTPIAIGGIVLQGPYALTAVTGVNTYQITAASAATSTVSNAGTLPVFATTIPSSVMTVTLVNHGLFVGSTFYVPTPTLVGGITLSGSYIVQSVADASHFTINSKYASTANDSKPMNLGNAQTIYYFSVLIGSHSQGYGIGNYGIGAYGIGSAASASPGSQITTTNWTLDNWGEVFIACPANGPIYTWSPESSFTVGTKILNAPEINGGIFVADPYQILVAWASSIGDVQDPLLINWSDSGDYTNWSVTALTQAGGYRIPTGSKIVGALQGPQFGIIWTDIDVWSMQYINPPLIFGFNKLAEECGLIARHAATVINSSVYWMSNNQFYVYAGAGVQPIVCPVWDFVFQDLNTAHLDKIHVASNNGFGEVAWYFPSLSGGTGEVDSYVKYNFILQCWDCGRLVRTAWIDQSVVGPPIGGTSTGLIYQHEVANDADGAPMGEFFDTGYAQIAQGDDLTFIDWMIPDFTYGKFNASPTAALHITLKATDYPNGVVKTKGPYVIDATTAYRNPRIRGRQIGMLVEGAGLGGWWRMGGLRYRGAPDGKR